MKCERDISVAPSLNQDYILALRLMIAFSRVVCECLLLTEGLSWKKEELWCQTMHLVRRIIGGVDYKVSVRLYIFEITSQLSILTLVDG